MYRLLDSSENQITSQFKTFKYMILKSHRDHVESLKYTSWKQESPTVVAGQEKERKNHGLNHVLTAI